MKAIAFTENGGPEVLMLIDVPDPLPKPGQVRIKVAVSGVNYRDIGVRKYGRNEGAKVPEPVVTGIEAAGVVEQLGDGVKHLQIGQRVATICLGGGYGDLVVVPAAQVIPLPDTLTEEVAGAFAMTGFTSWHLLHTVARIGPGDTILVHACAGGIGTMLTQLAKRAGVTVIGTVGSDKKIATAQRFGADHIINYQEVDFAEAVLEITGGQGVDVVFDAVGASTCAGDVLALRDFGTLISFGRASGPAQLGGDQLQPKSIRWAHFGVFTAWKHLDIWNRGVASLLPLISSGAVDPNVTEVYSWKEAMLAHSRLESRLTEGKLVLRHGS